MRNIVIFLALLNLALPVVSQETKMVAKSNNFIGESFFVLKNDKNIRQGQYLKYYDMLGIKSSRMLSEFGKYDNNQKTGIWLYFDPITPSNQLITAGVYVEGKRDGNWTYFYGQQKSDTSVAGLLRLKKITNIIDPEKKGDEFQVSTDIEGLKIASTGYYTKDKKTGIWKYYDRDQKLIYEYDFSAGKSAAEKEAAADINFDRLGGIERLQFLLYQSIMENLFNEPVYKSSIATFDILSEKGEVGYKNLKIAGADSFSRIVEKSLKIMSHDWVEYDANLENVLIQVQVGYAGSSNAGHLTIDYVRPQVIRHDGI